MGRRPTGEKKRNAMSNDTDPADGTPNSRRDTAIEDAIEQIRRALQGLQFGEVSVIVQDGVVVQLERRERRRLRGAALRCDARIETLPEASRLNRPTTTSIANLRQGSTLLVERSKPMRYRSTIFLLFIEHARGSRRSGPGARAMWHDGCRPRAHLSGRPAPKRGGLLTPTRALLTGRTGGITTTFFACRPSFMNKTCPH